MDGIFLHSFSPIEEFVRFTIMLENHFLLDLESKLSQHPEHEKSIFFHKPNEVAHNPHTLKISRPPWGKEKFEDFQEFSDVIKQALEKSNVKHQRIIPILSTACIVTFPHLEPLNEHKVSNAVEKAASLAAYSSLTGEKIPPRAKSKAAALSKNPLPQGYDLQKPFTESEISALQEKALPQTEAPSTVFVASQLPKHKLRPCAALFGEMKSIEKTKTKPEFWFRITYTNNKSAIVAHGTLIVHNGSIVCIKSLSEVTQSQKTELSSLLEEVEVHPTVQESVLWKKIKVGEKFGSITQKK